MNGREVLAATKFLSWDGLYEASDGVEVGLVVDGEPVRVTKVYSETKRDSDYDRRIAVVLKVGEQYFKRTGYMNVGSSCYDDYESLTWDNELTEVTPSVKTVTVYE